MKLHQETVRSVIQEKKVLLEVSMNEKNKQDCISKC